MPKVTLLLMAYRHRPYVTEALHSCLAQQNVPLEIIASDDASDDGTFEAMQMVAAGYTGPHQLVVRRNETNMGMVPHLNLLMKMAQGERIVIAAGDDVSFPHRVARLMQVFDSSPDIFAVYSNAVCISPEGEEIGLLYNTEEENRDKGWRSIASEGTSRVTGCGLAWRREVFDRFGALATELKAEDQAIPFRAALLGQIAYLPDALLYYRQSPASLSYWRRYRDAFYRVAVKEMRQLHQKMICKNLGDVSAMYHDLMLYSSVDNRQSALLDLRQRIEQLEVEQAIFSGVATGWALQSPVFRSTGKLRRLKMFLMVCAPSIFLLAKGALMLWRMRSTVACDK